MSKRVHEIAKERGLPAKEVLEKLRAAGINVKAVSSSVDEAAAAKALGNGGSRPAGNSAPASAPPTSAPRKSGDGKASAAKPREAKGGAGKAADGARAPRAEAQAPARETQAPAREAQGGPGPGAYRLQAREPDQRLKRERSG